MSDDLTAQVEERLFEMLNNPDIPEDDAGELAHELAPLIAACMRAVEEAVADYMHGRQVTSQHHYQKVGDAAGLAKLRGET